MNHFNKNSNIVKYEVTYSVTDTNGNTATEIFNFIVTGNLENISDLNDLFPESTSNIVEVFADGVTTTYLF